MKRDIKIFVVAHKEASVPANPMYQMMQVGAARGHLKGFKYYDDTDENISDKNKSFCELTALYWIWKNINCNVVGLVHYRRYFFKNRWTKNLNNVIDGAEIEEWLKEADVIVPEKQHIRKYDLYGQYKELHHIEDLEICRAIVKKKYPDYVEAFDKVMKQKWFYPYNMFVMRKELMDDYAKWLFSILFEAEKKIKTDNYDDYNKRVFGFLGERLFNIWMAGKELKVKEAPVNNVEESVVKNNVMNSLRKIAGGRK